MSDAVQQGFAFGVPAPSGGRAASALGGVSGAARNVSPLSAAGPLSVPAGQFGADATEPAAPGFAFGKTDAVTWLKSLPSESVDLVITDPPYESLEKHRAVGTTTRLKHSKASSNDWFQIFPNARFGELFEQVYRVLRRDTHFYLFCDAETMFVAQPAAIAAGFKFWKPLVWDKRKIGMGYHYRARYEFILFFEKGKRRLNDLAQPDVIECTRIRGGYPTEKPAFVSSVLVRQSTQRGQIVVDPFMGSGSVGEAALSQGRHFLGNDISPSALEWSGKRLPAWGKAADHLRQLNHDSARFAGSEPVA